MRILHISDTHSKHHLLQSLPPADIIIHSGDISLDGTEDEIIDFIEWFGALEYKYKIFIAGNHDGYLFGANIEGLSSNCFYLCNSGVTIDGVKFYGLPMFMEDVMSGNYNENINKIPSDTNVLVTHQPSYGILDYSRDRNFGDLYLLQTVYKIQPKYHLFGHIHDAYGIKKHNNTTFVNSSILNESFDVVNQPILLEYS